MHEFSAPRQSPRQRSWRFLQSSRALREESSASSRTHPTRPATAPRRHSFHQRWRASAARRSVGLPILVDRVGGVHGVARAPRGTLHSSVAVAPFVARSARRCSSPSSRTGSASATSGGASSASSCPTARPTRDNRAPHDHSLGAAPEPHRRSARWRSLDRPVRSCAHDRIVHARTDQDLWR